MGGRAGKARGAATTSGLHLLSLAILSVVGLLSGADAASPDLALTSARGLASYGQLPLSFVANRGQTDPRAAFVAHGKGYTLFLSPTETVLVAQPSPRPAVFSGLRALPDRAAREVGRTEALRASVVRMQLLGADPSSVMTGEEQTSTVNYLLGDDRSKWLTGVPAYGRIRAHGIYSGVDIVFYGNHRQFEYDFVVHPGADPRAIRLGFEGLTEDQGGAIRIDARGDLVLHTTHGDLRLRRPLAYQEIDGTRRPVEARYAFRAAPERLAAARPAIGIDVVAYDATRPLVIDPVLDYATYLGGSGNDAGMGIAVDAVGQAYVTGFTESPDFPAAGVAPAAGTRKAFVAKLNATGSAVLYATYLGGDGHDTATGVAVDPAGNAYVTGLTDSSNFPTVNGYQSNLGGTDVFVTKLDPSGSTLLYSTYFGGSGTDIGLGIAVDGGGQIYVTGHTDSADWPRRSAFQRPGGGADALVAKFNPSLSGAASLIYSTPLGGTGRDEGHAIAVNAQGEAHITGLTDSDKYPTQNSYQKDRPGTDAFVTKLSAAGNALLYSTYVGGAGTDVGLAIALDPAGMVHVTGHTDSADFPKKTPYQSAAQGGTDAFVAKLDPAVSGSGSLLYSTYLGGSGADAGLGIAVGSGSEVYVTGFTDSTNFPTLNGSQTDQPGRDAFVVKLQLGSGNALVYSTYVGGGGSDEAYGIALDAEGNAYITGLTQSADFPTAGAFATTLGGSQDAFVAKLIEPVNGANLTVSSLSAAAGAGASITVTETTKNEGNLAAAATTTKFYLSTDAAFDAGDVLLGSRAVPALDGAATSTASTALTIPSAVSAGSYFLIARADADEVISETEEDNNAASTPFTVGPDLVVSTVTAPAQGGAGASITVADTTANQGARPSVASTTKFYLSSDATLDAGDVLLGSRAIPVLAPGAVSSGSTTIAVPAGTAPGTYVVIAKADADGTNGETNEDNNSAASVAMSVGPDLIVSSLLVPATAGPGSSITVGNTIKNQGGGPAGAATVKFYLSTDGTFDASDVLLGNRAVPALAAGAISVESTSLTVPTGTAIGTYVVIARADADGAVAEANEDNNAATSTSLAIGADLVVSSVSAPATAAPGATVTVQDVTLNQSSASVGPSTTRFYLSSDTVLDGADVVLGSRQVPALGPSASSSAATSVTVPATAGGQFYIIAKANADGAVAETDTTNNTAYSGLVKLGADLVTAIGSAPATAGAGAAIAVTDTTQNLGAAAAGASTTRFYLSTDTVLDASDVALGSRAVPTLGASGGASTGSTSLTIPTGTAAGNYFLIARADADGAVVEMDEGNNTASRAMAIGSDLSVTQVSAPAHAGNGLTIAVTETTRNESEGAANTSTTSFYLSSDTALDASDVLLGSRAVPALAGSASSTATTTLTIPAGTSPGRYYVIARADSAGAIAETDEANNARASGEIKIGPDLAMDALTAPVSTAPGGSISVTDTVINYGGGAAGPFVVKFFFSTDDALDAADVYLGSRAVAGVAPGPPWQTSTGSTSLTLPTGLTGGTYHIIARADADGAIAEQDETNNTRVRSIFIGGDIVVWLDLPGASTFGAPGSPISVTDTTRNQSGVAVGASTTAFYLSSDTTLDPSDALLGSRAVPPLGPGESSTASNSLTLPLGIAGDYYVIAKANADGAIPEQDGDNNIAVTNRTVRIGADLVVFLDAPGAASPGEEGSPLSVTDTTRNAGALASGPSTTTFYASADGTVDPSDVLLGSRAVPALGPDEASTVTTTFTIPAWLSGVYRVIAQSDADHTVTGLVLKSSEVAVAIDAAGPAPAVVVTDSSKNETSGPVGASTTQFYLSLDGVVDSGDTPLGNRAVPALAPGEASTASTPFTIPAGVAGTYKVLAQSDVGNAVTSVVVEGGNLLVAADGSGASSAPGSTITVSDFTKNESTVPVGTSTTAFYLSTDPVLDDSDSLLASRAVPALAAGESSTASTPLTLPSSAFGTLYLIAKADAQGAVAEYDTTNNTAAKPILIGADLIVRSVSAPSKAGAGTSIQLIDVTVNLSAAPAGPSTTRFYLSTKATLDGSAVLLGTRAVPALTGASSQATTTLTIPAATATGKYYIIAVADADNSVTEADETNNITVSASMKIGPDLAVDALGAPAGGGAGATITLTDTIINFAPATAGASTVRFFFSTDATLDAADTAIGSRSVPPITGGTPAPTNSGSTTVTLPSSLAGGTYYIIAKADADEAVAEIHEDNNTRSRSITVGSDLVVTLDLAGSSATAAPGGTITVTDFTKNDSASPAGPTVTRFYLSTNSVLEPSDVAIGSRSIPALGAGATSSAANTLTLPTGIGGVYYVIARADADNAVAETNEDNNAIATAGTVRVGPDLVAWLDVPAASSTPAAGATISVTSFTRNDSSAPVGTTTTKIYLSTDATFDAGDTLVATRAVPALAPGEVNSSVSTFALPAGQTGTRHLFAKADADEAVFEANETNNVSAPKSISIGPDLIVWIDVPGGVASSAAGATVTVNDWTRSDNGAPAGASTTKFYLVTGTTVDASAVLLGSRAVPALGPSTTNTGSTALTLPATASGTYRIIAKADADNAVAEGNEDNNVSTPSTPFTIGPDLVAWLDVPAASSTPATGATITVTDFARNDAATAAPASTTKLYYSTSATFDASAVVVGSRAIAALGPGEVNSGTISFTLPAGHVGTRYLFARADADNAVVEANENNNTSAAKSINIGPDLIVWIDVPGGVASSAAGATVTVSDWTRSDNSAPAGASATKFYLVTGTTVDASAVLLGSRAVPALGLSTTNTGSTTLTLPATASGTYRIIAKADADNAVAEANEGNNLSAPSTPFTIGPDLVAWLDVPAAASTPATGATITVTDFARNDAATAAPASTTKLYYSTSATFDGSAIVVGSRAIPALAAGQVNSGTVTFALPSGHTGTRHLFARADADNAVVESNEANNVSPAKAITIGSDFIVWIDVPGSVTNGTVTVKDWTRSDNAAPVGASTTRFYLITGTTLDGSAISLGGRAVPALGPSTTNAGTTTLTLPATAAGTYRIIAKADGDDAVVEANENNNLSAASAPFTLGPDLRVFLDVPGAYAQVAAGSTLSITDVTRNDGTGGAGASSTWFYLSADAALDAGDVPLGSRAIPALAAGASSTGSTVLTLPAGIAGTYYIIAVADAAGAATETNEANNVTVSTPIEVGPDLTITGTTVPVKAAAGATVHISDVTKNRGGAPAPTTTTRIYLSADSALDAGDVLLGSRTIPALSAGIYNADTTAVVIPTTTPAGSYFIIVAGDAGAVVAESNEANNTLAKPIDILPDVRVTVLTAPSKAFPGSTITVGDTTVNQGAGAGPSATAFYLSSDVALDAGDLLLGSRAVPALGVGESNTGSVQVTIPAALAGGAYTIFAVGDASGVVPELDETNNTRTKTLTVGPDLTVSVLTVPSSAAVGATIIATDTTLNQGSAAAASTTKFYLALSTVKAAGDPQVGSRAVPALALNGSSTSSTMLTIPAGTAPGTYYVIAECDGGSAVVELTETNNTKSRAITITP